MTVFALIADFDDADDDEVKQYLETHCNKAMLKHETAIMMDLFFVEALLSHYVV